MKINARRRRIFVALGGAFLIAGFALLSFGLYKLVDDGGGPAGEESLLDLGEEETADILDLATPVPTNIPDLTPVPTPPPPLGDSPYTMLIDRIGINAPVKTFGLDKDAVPEVPLNATDVAWYDFSAKPGTGGNAVFAAHVTWNGRAVFYNLHELEVGDTIKLSSPDGTELIYLVSRKFSVDPDDPSSLQVMHSTDKDVITLITCGGSFARTNDPVFGGEYSQRLIVRGELVSVSGPGANAGG